jgi:hypothetical protein
VLRSGKVALEDFKVRIVSRTESITKTTFAVLPTGFVPNSFTILMSGGGGGGGGGDSGRPGSGGVAGEIRTVIIPDMAAGVHCIFVIGKGGGSNSRGSDSILECKNISL